VLAVDVLEDPSRGYLINEVNHTMEFHTLAPTTGVDVASLIVDFTVKVAKGEIKTSLPDVSVPVAANANPNGPLPAYSNTFHPLRLR
jgi:[lysine-biosynthesis-protein LysW]--L-2-aminoadipate ligase